MACAKVTLVNQLSPAWTTDWMSEAGKAKLKGYGIAPPAQQVIDISGLRTGGVKRQPMPKLDVICPNCGSHAYAADQPVRLHAVQGPVQMPGLAANRLTTSSATKKIRHTFRRNWR